MNQTSIRTHATIRQRFLDGFRLAANGGNASSLRIGAELKFPLVNRDGTAVKRDVVDRLWQWLIESEGWQSEDDGTSGRVVGARKVGPMNDTVASCETGYCKTEFSLAHAADLNELETTMNAVLPSLRRFAQSEGVRFLCYGTIPATAPGRDLLMKKERASVWDQAVPSNNRIPPERGDDVHLFTINAGSHVHVDVSPTNAVQAVNVLTGFAPAQAALTAHSPVWQGELDPEYQCVNEKLWDFWEPAAGRSAMPQKPFADLDEYIHAVLAMKPIYVKRECGPVLLPEYATFRDFYESETACGVDLNGNEVTLVPEEADLALHNSCYWYCARISRYYTVENRIFDQQPADALLAPAALTVGLMHNLEAGAEALSHHSWESLRELREAACRHGLREGPKADDLRQLATLMLDLAEAGLAARGHGEERHLAVLRNRLNERTTPADEAIQAMREGGIEGLVELRSL